MITEDYVNDEIFKLLKEKGFDDSCCRFVIESDETYYRGAPTLQMAMKWLREVHNIDIFPWKIGKGIYSCAIFNSNTGQDLSSDKDFPSEKYEEAAEAAVKYCLENLI
jgi:hypothetical protein